MLVSGQSYKVTWNVNYSVIASQEKRTFDNVNINSEKAFNKADFRLCTPNCQNLIHTYVK
jgi:hypothetical protein